MLYLEVGEDRTMSPRDAAMLMSHSQRSYITATLRQPMGEPHRISHTQSCLVISCTLQAEVKYDPLGKKDEANYKVGFRGELCIIMHAMRRRVYRQAAEQNFE